MSISSIISIIGITQILFLFFLLGTRKKDRDSNTLFFFYSILAVFLIDLFWMFCYENQLLGKFWFLSGFEALIPILYGPLLFFLVQSQFDSAFKLKLVHSLHLIVPLLTYTFFSPILLGNVMADYFSTININIPAAFVNYDLSDLVFFVLWRVHVFIYLFLIYRYFTALKRKGLFDNLSNRKEIRKRLVVNKFLIITYIIFPLTGVFDLFLNYSFKIDIQAYYFNFCLLVIHVFTISYIVFLDKNIILKKVNLFKKKYSNLSNIDTELLEKKISNFLVHKKVFLDPDMTLTKMADLLSISTHQLSEYFNDRVNESFKDYINKYRIDYSKEMLLNIENKKYTLEGIAHKSGYRSLATFHRNFKKHTNNSPSKWLTNHNRK